MALVAFQQKKGISVHCRQIGHKLQATRASSPFSIAQQHRRAHRHPAISRFVARRCGHAALLSHSCLGVCERCCSLIFFASCSFHISPTQHSLSLSPDALSLPVSPHRRHGSKPGGRDSQSAAMGAWAALAAARGGSAPACGAVVWREARRLDGRCGRPVAGSSVSAPSPPFFSSMVTRRAGRRLGDDKPVVAAGGARRPLAR